MVQLESVSSICHDTKATLGIHRYAYELFPPILDEHPQIIALIISYLDSGLGADVLNLLPEEMQADVIARIANLDTVGPDALLELEDVMQKKFKANTSLRATQVGGIKAAAAIMNFTNQEQESKIRELGILHKNKHNCSLYLIDTDENDF